MLDRYQDVDSLAEAFVRIPFTYGSGNLADALKTTRSQMFRTRGGDRPSVQDIALIITDGMPAPTLRRVAYEARRAREAGIHIMLLGIGLDGVLDPTDVVSEPYDKSIFTTDDFNSLEPVQKPLMEEICNGQWVTTVINVNVFVLVKYHADDKNITFFLSKPLKMKFYSFLYRMLLLILLALCLIFRNV